MSENTKIEWCDHTFNPWVGCEKVSPGCAHCYAESWSRRTGNAALWNGDRRRTSASNWKLPVKWNRRAQVEQRGWEAGVVLCGGDEEECIARGFIKPKRPRVFCASLADVFDNAVPSHWRWDLFKLIDATPHLDWLLLTKRIGNARAMLNDAAAAARNDFVGAKTWDQAPWPNVWLGATVVNQEEADRGVPKLLETPAAVRWVSAEPLLEQVTFFSLEGPVDVPPGMRSPLDWIVVGGESGPGARPFSLSWAHRIVEQCRAVGAAVFIKQLGASPHHNLIYGTNSFSGQPVHFEPFKRRDRKGGDIAEFPADLQVREWPAGVQQP